MMNGSVALFYVFAVVNWTLGMQIGYELQYNAWPYHFSRNLRSTGSKMPGLPNDCPFTRAVV